MQPGAESRPESAGSLVQPGHRATRAGRRPEALESLKKTATLTRDSADAQNSVGLEFLELAAYPEAKRYFRRAIALAPRLCLFHIRIAGKLLERQKRYKEAEASFRTAIRLQPDLAPAYANLCGILNAQKQYAAAETAGRRHRTRRQRAAGTGNLSSSLIGRKRFAEAETACRKAIELEHNTPEAWGNLGQALAELFRLGEAENRLHDRAGA